MRNPLLKRLKREFLSDVVKYILILLFLVLPIALCSGYMVGNDSMLKSYNDGVESYKLEDGHFSVLNELSNEDITNIEFENNITIYNMYYKDEKITNKDSDTIRLYNSSSRENINKWCVHKGSIPTKGNEIALDRLYCENNKINLGDTISLQNNDYVVTAIISLIDYTSLFKNNSDSMFNANSFSISIVSNEAFNSFSNENLVYNYSYLYPTRLNDIDSHNKTEELTKNLYKYLITNSNNLDEIVPKESNQAINFAVDDISGDLTMMIIFGAIIIFGIAFVFALSTKSQIEKEAKSIGTLKALGFKNSEVLSQFLLLPTITTLIAGIIGNILGYTVFKSYIVSLYYHSYSLPLYQTFYNPKALLLTTIIPILLVFVINLLIILKSLNVSCLNLLKGITKKNKTKKVKKLSNKLNFIFRYQIRVILQNKGTYIALFFGSLLATLLLLFGLMMTPLLDNYKNNVKDSLIANYQTILKVDVEVSNEAAEKVYFTQLNYGNDEIIIYGVVNYGANSNYLENLNFSDTNKVIINSSLQQKYKLKANKNMTLTDKYSKEEYTFAIDGVYSNDGSLIIFMDSDLFLNNFTSYMVSYFSKNKLDINNEYVYKIITLDDLLVMADQLTDSMGRVFLIFTIISILLFVILTFLLAKIVIEKSQSEISMLKILGYKTKDINKVYNLSTGIVTLISIIISTVLSVFIIKVLWELVLRYEMKGWLNYYVAPYLYPLIILIGILSFMVVYIFESIKISKISLADALKDDLS